MRASHPSISDQKNGDLTYLVSAILPSIITLRVTIAVAGYVASKATSLLVDLENAMSAQVSQQIQRNRDYSE